METESTFVYVLRLFHRKLVDCQFSRSSLRETDLVLAKVPWHMCSLQVH